MKKIKYLRERYNEIVKRKDIVTFNESRRKFITASAAAVSGYAFIGAGIGAIQKDNYQIIEKDITIKNLPAELRGINIILFSDIHSGPYMNEDMMREYTNVINGMNPDLILIPGDMTNSQKTEVIPFTKAFRDLKSKYGIYGTLGNHDYFNDANYIADAIINESPVKMLRNNSATVEIKGKFINILGIEDTRDSGVNNNALLVKYADEALNTLNKNHTANPNILLCHKPYVFDDL
ncbi:MAG: metallophosphoesterase [Ignavibacteriae bacterium]|nr:metallophosphoesterase [Ignavibacteriota bacterium]